MKIAKVRLKQLPHRKIKDTQKQKHQHTNTNTQNKKKNQNIT